MTNRDDQKFPAPPRTRPKPKEPRTRSKTQVELPQEIEDDALIFILRVENPRHFNTLKGAIDRSKYLKVQSLDNVEIIVLATDHRMGEFKKKFNGKYPEAKLTVTRR